LTDYLIIIIEHDALSVVSVEINYFCSFTQ